MIYKIVKLSVIALLLAVSSCSFFREKPEPEPLDGIIICVDAGHGAQSIYAGTGIYTGGTKGAESGAWESDVNLKAALALRNKLKRAGATVVMTREHDIRITGSTGTREEELKRRVEIAEEQGAHLLISLHHNYSPNPSVSGPSAYYHSKGNPYDKALAESIHSYLLQSMPGVDHGVHGRGFVVLANTGVPAVIVEFGFMSNLAFDRQLQEPFFAEKEAEAVYRGVLKFIEQYRAEVASYVSNYYDPNKPPSPTVETRFGARRQ